MGISALRGPLNRLLVRFHSTRIKWLKAHVKLAQQAIILPLLVLKFAIQPQKVSLEQALSFLASNTNTVTGDRALARSVPMAISVP